MHMWKLLLAGLAVGLVGCSSSKDDLVGVWKATSVDMSFARGKVPAERMDEVASEYLKQNAPAFDLNADDSAQLFGGGGESCRGTWSMDERTVKVTCAGKSLELERRQDKLVSMPDRTFTFERQ